MKLRNRRIIVILFALGATALWLFVNPESYDTIFSKVENAGEPEITASSDAPLATELLEKLAVKGRAPKTGYSRAEFYDDWPLVEGCSLRQRILKRELGDSAVLDGCNVIAGEYDEPYTGEHVVLESHEAVSEIQIDHVVALSDAWQKGAQYMDYATRNAIATDPLNLLAVDGPANQQKSDGDAATWLPSNKKFRCQYVARQVSVKYKYSLWVTQAEKDAILRVLKSCPNEPAVGV
ncbi:HNH endonuclease [Candidatus Saccharibacteria bacterium]|nr:HNH endonuclease [Candidatus Saccharibacteria bacterium]